MLKDGTLQLSGWSGDNASDAFLEGPNLQRKQELGLRLSGAYLKLDYLVNGVVTLIVPRRLYEQP